MLLFVSSQRNKTAYFYLLLVLHFMVIYLKVYTPIEIRCALNKKVFSDLTRLTFFRVKLVFECDFEISWSLRPLYLGTLGPLSSQQVPEVLSSLHFVMLCPYLRGHLTFGGYFFTRWALLYRPFNIWCKLGQKCLFRGSVSMEVRWPPSSKSCQVHPKRIL